MHYCLYQITNLVNGKIYVGVHKTKSLDDGYMGSGKVIRRAIAKHGIENFTKDILETFDTSEAMYAREAEVVNEEFLARVDVYNLRRGGRGGFEYINGNNLSGYKTGIIKGGESLAKRLQHDKEFFECHSERSSQNIKLRYENGLKSKIAEYQHLGVDAAKTANLGTMWITSGTMNKKIKKTDLIPDGFRKGRVAKGRGTKTKIQCPVNSKAE
jgi:hypothetical protein